MLCSSFSVWLHFCNYSLLMINCWKCKACFIICGVLYTSYICFVKIVFYLNIYICECVCNIKYCTSLKTRSLVKPQQRLWFFSMQNDNSIFTVTNNSQWPNDLIFFGALKWWIKIMNNFNFTKKNRYSISNYCCEV